MGIRILPYITVEVDEKLRRRVRNATDRLRVNVRSYLLSAADDVDTAGDKVRNLCDAAVDRVDTVVAKVSDRIDPKVRPEATQDTRLEAG